MLRRMTQPEYDLYYPRSLKSLADELAKAYELGPAESIQAASRSFSSLLPDGRIDIPDHYLYVITSDQRDVGALWFHLRRTPSIIEAYVLDIVIDEGHRGRGVATAAMHEAELAARSLGARRIALSVFEHNRAAQQMYTHLGFRVGSRAMFKCLV